jgi:sulfur relay (sulfurtransferase) DsrF/TusC family protein
VPEHLLIESQGAWAGPGCERFVRDALALVGAGHDVCLFLVQDGVTAALPGAVPSLGDVLRLGGRVWVDDHSLGQRGLAAPDLAPGAEVVGMDAVAGRLLEPSVRAVWH